MPKAASACRTVDSSTKCSGAGAEVEEAEEEVAAEDVPLELAGRPNHHMIGGSMLAGECTA
jgi:hypothetical protein